MDINVNIFYDESGKNREKINLIGGLLIPEKIYNLKEIQKINYELREENFSIHWTQYNGTYKEKEKILEIFNVLAKYHYLLDFNVIFFEKTKNIKKEDFDLLNYIKFPERIMYGLMRFTLGDKIVVPKIYIEHSSEYVNQKLDEKMMSSLNLQSVYRGENFKIKEKPVFKKKNEEIGIEITDVLLGIVGSIIQNNNDNDLSTSKREKNKIIIELLKNENFFKFLSNIKLFKWFNSHKLEFINFEEYIKNFLIGQDEWIEYISNL